MGMEDGNGMVLPQIASLVYTVSAEEGVHSEENMAPDALREYVNEQNIPITGPYLFDWAGSTATLFRMIKVIVKNI